MRISPRRPARCAIAWTLGALLWVSGGCTAYTQQSFGVSSTSVVARDRHRGYLEQVHRRFERAVLHKPRDGTATGRRLDLAPLLVHEVPGGARNMTQPPRFGALEATDDGHVRVNAELPTVYVEAGATSLRGPSYDTMTYRWFYPIETPLGSIIVQGGLRIVIGADGFPVVYETAHADPSIEAPTGRRSLFVSASFELSAEAEYGPALGGRRFAAERSVEDAPGALVLRVLEDGPLPMGPFLYVAASSRRIITMHCRCSPSQMDEVIESEYYDLVPFERVRGLFAREPLVDLLSGADSVDLFLNQPLERVLRWPR